MSQQQLIDFTAARALRDAKIAQAVEHADDVTPAWSERAYAFLVDYARHNQDFTIEDVRLASAGLVSEPPHARAWGGVAMRASREKLLVPIGFAQSKRDDGHCMNLRVWGSTVYIGAAG
jgi:hypothetical protein